MPRPPRLEFAGGLYHLISRGNGRKRIFLGDDAGLNQRQIGRHYVNITSMAVCMARRRFREEEARKNPGLQKTLAQLERMIAAED